MFRLPLIAFYLNPLRTPPSFKPQKTLMASINIFLLQLSIFLLIFLPKPCFPKNQTLFFPLKTQALAHYYNYRATANKLSFHHNVSLTVSLKLGSPPQDVTMVLDTGSELSWLHCKKTVSFNSIFNPLLSSSYSPVPCNSPTCKIDLDGIIQAEEASQVKAKIQHSPLNLILLEWRENVTPHRPSSLLPKLQLHLLLRDFSYN